MSDSLAEDLLKEPAPKGRKKYQPKHTGKAVAKPAKVSRTRESLQQFSTDGDLVDIWERRMLNPNVENAPVVHIKTPGMNIRWINLSHRGRFQRARYEQGWVPVKKDELVDEREIYGVTYTSEGYVCRGEKQSEMLMKIPEAVWKQIQKRRAELNRASYKKLRQAMGSAGAQHFKERYGGSAGDQAEEAASQFVGSVKFGTERVSTDELFE